MVPNYQEKADVRLDTSAGEDAGHQLGGTMEGCSLIGASSVREHQPLEGEKLAAARVLIDQRVENIPVDVLLPGPILLQQGLKVTVAPEQHLVHVGWVGARLEDL